MWPRTCCFADGCWDNNAQHFSTCGTLDCLEIPGKISEESHDSKYRQGWEWPELNPGCCQTGAGTRSPPRERRLLDFCLLGHYKIFMFLYMNIWCPTLSGTVHWPSSFRLYSPGKGQYPYLFFYQYFHFSVYLFLFNFITLTALVTD